MKGGKTNEQLMQLLRLLQNYKILAENPTALEVQIGQKIFIIGRQTQLYFVPYLKYFLIIFLTMAPYLIAAQKEEKLVIDSLSKELLSSREDTNKVKLLVQLSYAYSNINPDECIRFGQKALDLSYTIYWQNGIDLAMVDLGIGHEAKFDHAKALDYYQKALASYEQKDDKASIAKVLVYTAYVYLAQSNYSRALACNFKALNIYQNLGERKSSAMVIESIGSIYFEQKEYSKAKEYYANALLINNDIGDKESIARNLYNSGILFGAQGNHREAVKQYLKALKIYQDMGQINYIEMTRANIGDDYSQLKEYQNALEYQQNALNISEKIGNKNIIATNIGNIGETYLRMYKDSAGQPKQLYLRNALQYLANAVSICRKTNYRAPLIEFCRSLSDAYFLSGDFKKAFENLNLYTVTKDSVFSLQSENRIIALEQAREEELKNKEIIIKDKQIQINQLILSKNNYKLKLYITGIILLLLGLVMVLKNLYDYRKNNSELKKKLKRESTEKILIKEKMQESEEYYKKLFNLNPSPIWVLGSERLNFLQVNDAAIKNYGYTSEEFLSMTVKDIKMESDMEVLEDDLKKNVKQGFPLSIFTRHRRKNTEEFYVEVIFNSIPFKGESAILVIAEDISIQVDYIKAIEIQNDKLREIGWIQSHKVRSPLANILGLVDLLHNYNLPEVEFKEVLQGIFASSQKLDDIIWETTEKTSTYDVNNANLGKIKKLFPDNFNIANRSY